MTKNGLYYSRQASMPGKHHGKQANQRLFTDVVRLQGYRCAKCLCVTKYHTVDHIIPRCKGGTDEISNLQILCLDCHRIKDNWPRSMCNKK